MKTSAYKYLLIAALGVLLTGCYDDDMLSGAGGNLAGGGSPIVLSAAYPTLTRASDAGFEDGDNMGVYVLDYEGDTPQDMDGIGINANNVRFRFNATDNSWTGATDIYWKDNTTPADIIGYYPFMSAVENPKVVPFSITARQDQPRDDANMGGYEASDFLWAKSPKTMPSDWKVELTFTHLMAGMRVTLQEGFGFSQGEWSGLEKTVIVPDIVSSASIDLENGEVGVSGSARVSVVPYENNGEWRAVVVPQTLPAGNKLVSLNVGGAPYSLTKETDLTLVSGKLHSFTITVNKKAAGGDYEFVLTDEAITVWIDDAEFRDGLMREYVTVEVDSRGALQSCVEASGLNPAEVTNLKIKGELNEEDFRYIREKMDFIKALNLLDAEVYERDRKGVIPENALRDKVTLQRVVFPRYLTVIGSCAFAGSGLMGDLIIPEGVTHIGTRSKFDSTPGHWDGTAGAFQDCNSLVGTLSLPSTLKFIETSAFRRTNLTGDLAFPDGVTFIGACAFDSSGFDGTMSLPEKIEVIGPGAFFRCRVTGNLNIPQGITRIYDSTFTGGNYQLLTLPEGLRVVEAQAFNDCGIRGELVIPSTCKRLEMYAFAGNNISSIVFPKEMSFLGKGCFERNSRLSGTLTFPAGLSIVNEYCFNACPMLEGVILGEEVTQVGGAAFMDCYNLTSIVVNNPEPPLLNSTRWDSYVYEAFTGVPKDNFVIQVPGKSVDAYKSADGWREFKRIAAYSNFVCRPAQACALPSRHQESLVLNSDGKWSVTHQPAWCTLSRTSGNGKTEITLTINELSKGSGSRKDYIEFALEGTEFTTRCEVSQYDYAYDEDQCIQLQRATKGNGIDILFVGDGWDGEAIANGKYLDLVNQQMEAFFGLEPYTTLRDRFNVYACFSLSQETGVNTTNMWRNTRFSTLYANGPGCSVSGLVLDDSDAVFDYAVEHSPLTRDKMPRSLIIMALNSEEYGSATILTGSGSAISICCATTDPYPMDLRGMVQHEAGGHGFGKLAEERIVRNAYVPSGVKGQIQDCFGRGWYQNISLTGKMTDVNWSAFIFDPRYSDKVDVFEGGFGYTRGVYRSEINSCMNYGIPYYSAAARLDIMRRILEYSGEGFSMEKFYALDSDKWGSTGSGTRAPVPSSAQVATGIHNPVRIVKSRKY